MSSISVLSVASEIYPVIKTGGLADVVGALPMALRAEGIQTRTLVPGYPAVTSALEAAEEVLHLPNFHGGSARVLSGSGAGIDLFVLDAAHLFARPGNPYSSPDGADWPDNAIRFAPPASVIRLTAWVTDDAVTMSVEDQGPGIAPEHLPHVFDRFYKGDVSRRGMAGGSGLGLSIAKAIVERHGGRISVSSRAGQTRFELTIPHSQP